MNGIGTGVILNGSLYAGASGNAGDIAHMTVNMYGGRCSCGKVGCLESYANIEQLRTHISALTGENTDTLTFRRIISRLNKGDISARSAMREYVSALSVAISNMLHCLDINTVIFGYDGCEDGDALEILLEEGLRLRMKNSGQGVITVKKSAFHSDAPLIGATAIVAERVFEGK